MEQTKQRIRIDHWIAAILLFTMAAIAFINVLSRYLFHFSFASTEEITINLFVWMTVVGSGIAFERGAQLGMVTLYNIFPDKFKKIAILFGIRLSAILFLFVDIYIIQAIYDELTLFQCDISGIGHPCMDLLHRRPNLLHFRVQGHLQGCSLQIGGAWEREAGEIMEILLISIVFLLLMALGVPIGTCLGIAAVVTIIQFDLGIGMLGVNFSTGIASFPLLAIPFFVLAGVILEKAGLAATIAHFFELVVGKTVGGLAMVAVLTCMFWGALSGSGPATTAAVGLILLAPMIRHGYDKSFAGATIANSSDLSIILPPSIAFIIYGNITSVSVSALFVAGIIPGLVTGAGTVVVAYIISRRRGYKGLEKRGNAKEILIALKKSIWAILTPIIILGGIYAGIFTPTEAAVVAVFYSLFVAVFVYHSITWRDLIRILVDASVTSSVIMFLVVFAGIFTWAASVIGIIDLTANAIIKISPNAVTMIILVNFLLLGLGMILDAISISYLIMPILMPVLSAFGVDPLWYGVIFISALAIGQATPPVGVNLFTAANLIKGDVDSVAKEAIPFVIMDVIVLIILTLFPILSLYLPVTAGLYTP